MSKEIQKQGVGSEYPSGVQGALAEVEAEAAANAEFWSVTVVTMCSLSPTLLN